MAHNSASLRELLSKWDARDDSVLAPLTADDQNSVLDLVNLSTKRPLPDLPIETTTNEPQNPSDPAPSAAETPEEPTPTVTAAPDQAIETTHQFFAWFDQLEAAQIEQQTRRHTEYQAYLLQCQATCEALLQEIDNTATFLETLRQLHASASTKTTALHTACDRLLQEQTSLETFAQAIQQRLAFFTEFEAIAKKLSSPTFSVLSDQFLPLLGRIDEILGFLQQHPEYKDASTYHGRFKQLHSKALAIIRAHVTNTLKTATQSVQMQQQGAEHADAAAGESFTLFYGKFRIHAPRIRTLVEELERRRATAPDYEPVLDADLEVEYKSDLTGFVRAASAYIASYQKRACGNEHQLFSHFFPTRNAGFTQLIDSLSRLLYDAARPQFFRREIDLNALVDLCHMLRMEMSMNTADYFGAFRDVLLELFQDAQQRLIYKAENYMDLYIRGFSPTKADLNYPERLEVATDEPQSMWYRPVVQALTLLSKLYTSIEKTVCEGIAREILYAALDTLEEGFRLLKGQEDSINAHLFYIKHLLVLREQLAPFKVDFSSIETEVDFSSTREAAFGLLAQGSAIFRLDSENALLNFLVKGTPVIVKNQRDARRDIDEKLRTMCHDFINIVVQALTSPLASFRIQAKAFASSSQGKTKLSNQGFASPAALSRLFAEQQQTLHDQLHRVARLLDLYLGNSQDAAAILFRPVQGQVLTLYGEVLTLLQASCDAEHLAQVEGLPILEEVKLSVILPSLAKTEPAAATSTSIQGEAVAPESKSKPKPKPEPEPEPERSEPDLKHEETEESNGSIAAPTEASDAVDGSQASSSAPTA
ncbi:uncharacterized protein MONBRDRAFT_31482 [Monosiga brevicollis MX1]|uniref:Conserved oligomeric Golgi complex subunit 3 n=1 Tax=Monosiga brevicollis TaxID=81824 RepID=A9UTG6_MONBE|nr:uncharacterized protein MONBRDRAFT_31482 [Monosiga brevicollis MX1]EDQ91490.1 predicted protein [Monosiga brevicollis MX1]|eukprot:XP_001743912.1 hypothetical protein [Monosiga brevicollis MX1]